MAEKKKLSPEPEPDVDRGYAWVILSGCFFIYLFAVGTVKAYGVLYTEMVSYFGSGSGNTAWIGSTVLLFMLGLSPVANMLSRRFSFRRVSFVGGILLGFGYFLSGFCRKMEFMYLTYGLCGGLGYGLSFSPSSTIISYYFNKNRALANGLAVSASGIGALVFPFLYRYLIDLYGLPGTFWIVGAILWNSCVAASVLRQPKLLLAQKRKVKVASHQTPDQHELLNGTNPNNSSPRKTICACPGLGLKLSLFKNARFSMYCVAFIFCMNGYGNNLILIPAQIKALGYDKNHVVYGVTIMGGCETVARIFFGWLADRKFIKRKHIFLTSMLISSVFCFITPLFDSFTFMAVFSAIIGTFPGSFWSLISVLLIDVVGLENFTPAFGLAMVCLALGVVISQPTVGWLQDYTGSWNASFILTGCLLLTAGLIVCCEPLIVRIFMTKDESRLDVIQPLKGDRDTELVVNVSNETDSLLDTSEAEVSFTSARISRIYRPHNPEKRVNSSPESPEPICDTRDV